MTLEKAYKANPVLVGHSGPLALTETYASGANKGEAVATESALAVVIDPERQLTATADADGDEVTFVSETLADLPTSQPADDFLNGCPVSVTSAATGKTAEAYVIGYEYATGTLTLSGLPWSVAEGDTLTVLGYPLQPQDEAEVTGDGNNIVTVEVGLAAYAYAGVRHVLLDLTHSGSWTEPVKIIVPVLPR